MGNNLLRAIEELFAAGETSHYLKWMCWRTLRSIHLIFSIIVPLSILLFQSFLSPTHGV